MFSYLSSLSRGKIVLWCYLIWYTVMVIFYFDPSPAIWLNSIGISAVIGIALLLSVDSSGSSWKENKWQLFRLFFMPFGVSSFSSLIKGQGFILIVPSNAVEVSVSVGACLLFVLLVMGVQRLHKTGFKVTEGRDAEGHNATS